METIAYYECLADENNSIHHNADTENSECEHVRGLREAVKCTQ